ncbi:hypothetical protein EG329_007044 [Mollisiaceae sp. DMI_Dod_QoI]|nr:hypothetical protein EG329_007044 [Helotiales sp. DMI_Dod_QoI]
MKADSYLIAWVNEPRFPFGRVKVPTPGLDANIGQNVDGARRTMDFDGDSDNAGSFVVAVEWVINQQGTFHCSLTKPPAPPSNVRFFKYSAPSVWQVSVLVSMVELNSLIRPARRITRTSYSKITILLFTAIFVIAFLMFLFLSTKLSHIPSGEKKLLLAVALSYPYPPSFIYGLLVDFANDRRFNSFFGNATFYLCMAVLTEFIVVGPENSEMGHGHQPVNSVDSHTSEDRLSNTRQQADRPRRKIKGLISWLYFQAKDAYDSHKEGTR